MQLPQKDTQNGKVKKGKKCKGKKKKKGKNRLTKSFENKLSDIMDQASEGESEITPLNSWI